MLIGYPRAETRFLPESLIGQVPQVSAGLQVGQSFAAIPVSNPPLIRRGLSGTFSDKGLTGGSHHAVIPNANTVIEHAAGGTAPLVAPATPGRAGVDRAPTPAMKAYVVSLAKGRGLKPPRGYAGSGAICRAFLDKHAGRIGATGDGPPVVTERTQPLKRRPGPEPAPSAKIAASKARNGRARSATGRTNTSVPPGPARFPASNTVAGETRLNIPYGNKETAQKLGAQYRDGAWYGPAGLDLSEFRDRGWT